MYGIQHIGQLQLPPGFFRSEIVFTLAIVIDSLISIKISDFKTVFSTIRTKHPLVVQLLHYRSLLFIMII